MKCAIVDLGSNTIRLSLYNTLENGGFETLFSKKYMAGLAGYVSHGIMSNDGINQACAVLLDFKILLQQLGVIRFLFQDTLLDNFVHGGRR